MARLASVFLFMNCFLSTTVFTFGVIDSFNDIVTALNSLPGHTSISIVQLQGDKRELRAQDMHPLGSGFKLYVLAALERMVASGTMAWEDRFPILHEFKSLPSGVLQNQKSGEHFSLYEFAEYMIKISDNTATDHLISIIGRKKVEEILAIVDNKFYSKNLPFLLTTELFKIKWGCHRDVFEKYLSAGQQERRDMLDGIIKETSLDSVGKNGLAMDEPTLIRDIEWFGSVVDLCRIMQELKNKNSPHVFKALSQNAPFVDVSPQSFWKYAGFKGGSEPGVFTSAYLLQDKHEQWYTIAIAWHNEQHRLDETIFFELNKKVIQALEKGKIF